MARFMLFPIETLITHTVNFNRTIRLIVLFSLSGSHKPTRNANNNPKHMLSPWLCTNIRRSVSQLQPTAPGGEAGWKSNHSLITGPIYEVTF